MQHKAQILEATEQLNLSAAELAAKSKELMVKTQEADEKQANLDNLEQASLDKEKADRDAMLATATQWFGQLSFEKLKFRAV